MRQDGKTTKQIATAMKLGELSGVTVPAHTGADVTIIKFATTDEFIKSVYSDVLTEEVAEQALRNHLEPLWQMNYALREAAEKIMTDSDIIDKKAAMRESVMEYFDSVKALFNITTEAAPMADQPQNDELTLFKALAEMDDVRKAHYHALPDAEAKADFLKLSADEQTALVTISKVSDESHTMQDGTVITKSKAGEMYAVLKSQDAALRKMQAEQEFSKAFAAVAADIPNVPGEPLAKAKMWQGIQSLPAADRDLLTTTLKAADVLWKERKAPAADPAAVESGDAEEKLEKLAKARAEEKGETFAVAYSNVIKTEAGAALLKEMEG